MYTEFLLQALSLIGGLAFFLYGMNVMGDGLTRLSGGRLERILEKLTDNRIKAVLLGAGVTAVIQSSSATTVTVVGFVNSGIMKLNQAIGVIMGANIGTTVTSWILSLTGIEGNNLLVTLLKPTSFTPILAIVGIFLIMASKQEKRKDIGAIMIGFAILMFGMDTMSAAVKPLADVPQFTHILTMFSNPILGMLAGAILTAIIQSSSASVGILQALCLTGSVPYATAIPIIMGQNIGTCVTALLSSIGAGKNAKRAALVHLYFNVIGTTVFMILFYSLYAFIDFSFMHDAAGVAGIAVIHSLFNIGATILLFPFANMLEKLATLTIREDEEETTSEFARLDSRFLDSPALALEQCERSANEMAYLTLENVTLALEGIHDYSEEKRNQVIEMEEKIDRYEEEIPARRGVPQIEVTFDIDANGIVNVSAKDLGTGKEQHITITAGSNMSDEDIDKAVKEAAEFEAQDKKRKDAIDARNEADSMVFQTQKAMDEAGDKLDASDKAAVEADLNALKALVDGSDPENMTDAQVDEIKAAKEKLMESAQKLFAKLYESQQAAGGAGPDMGAGAGPDMGAGASNGSAPYGDDVVDGDYKEV